MLLNGLQVFRFTDVIKEIVRSSDIIVSSYLMFSWEFKKQNKRRRSTLRSMQWSLENITKIKRVNLSCLSYYRLLNAEVSVSMFFCLLCYVFFWTFWGWGIATLFSLSRVQVRQDWKERNGRGENGKPYFLSFSPSIQFPPWLAFFVRFACFPRSRTFTSRPYIPYSKWLSGKGTHMAADKDRRWGIHLKFEVKL